MRPRPRGQSVGMELFAFRIIARQRIAREGAGAPLFIARSPTGEQFKLLKKLPEMKLFAPAIIR